MEITTYQPDDFKKEILTVNDSLSLERIDIQKLMEAIIVLSHQVAALSEELENIKRM